MAPRANWKGYLRLSLVSCPIALYPASSLSEKVSFNRINRKTGNRLKQQNVDSETGEVVSRDDMVRGYEVAKGHYMVVEDEEIEAVQIESTRTIDIDQFVPKNEIDERYIDSPYYFFIDALCIVCFEASKHSDRAVLLVLPRPTRHSPTRSQSRSDSQSIGP